MAKDHNSEKPEEETGPLYRQIGIFAGLFSSADGRWVPIQQLRRMSATAAWMLFYGFVAYAATKAKIADPWGFLGIVVLGPLSFWLFLVIGGHAFAGERK